MKRLPIAILILTVMVQLGFGQWTQKIKIYTGAGAVFPRESFFLIDFFPKMIQNVYGVQLEKSLQPVSSAENFETYWNTGVNIGAGLEYELRRHLSLQLGFHYALFGFNEAQVKTDLNKLFKTVQAGVDVVDFSANRGTVGIYSIALNLKASLPTGFFTPYLVGGGGFMILNQEPVEISSLTEPLGASFSYRIPEEKTSAITGMGGGGIQIKLSKTIHPFVEGIYHLGLTENENTTFYTFKAGLVFDLK